LFGYKQDWTNPDDLASLDYGIFFCFRQCGAGLHNRPPHPGRAAKLPYRMWSAAGFMGDQYAKDGRYFLWHNGVAAIIKEIVIVMDVLVLLFLIALLLFTLIPAAEDSIQADYEDES
jgi:hypothetical protein